MSAPLINQFKENNTNKDSPPDLSDENSIYKWLVKKITSKVFRNPIKQFIDENCQSFIGVEENSFEQGELFNEFTLLIENLLEDVLKEGNISEEMFTLACKRGLDDEKSKKYFEQIISFSNFNYFKSMMTKRNFQIIKYAEEQMSKKEQNKELLPSKEEIKETEEKELEQAIKMSLALEDEVRRLKEIEDEELRRAIKLSLKESAKMSQNTTENPRPKKPEIQSGASMSIKGITPNSISAAESVSFEGAKLSENSGKKSGSPEKFETKRPGYMISKNEISVGGERNNNQVKSDVCLEFGSKFKAANEGNNDKKAEIVSGNKGFGGQIGALGINFDGEKKKLEPVKVSNNVIENLEVHKTEKLIDDDGDEPEANKNKSKGKNVDKTDINKIVNKTEVKSEDKKDEDQTLKIHLKEKEKEREKEVKNATEKKAEIRKEKPIKNLDENALEKKMNDIIMKNEMDRKDVVKEPLTAQKPTAAEIIKSSLKNEDNTLYNENKVNDEIGDLIDDDEPEDKTKQQSVNINSFIDKKKDIKLGKIKLNKDGGNFIGFSVGSNMSDFNKDGLNALEKKISESATQKIIPKKEDKDLRDKMNEIDRLKKEKLNEFRNQIIQLKAEERQKEAEASLTKEELIKLEARRKLAESLKKARK